MASDGTNGTYILAARDFIVSRRGKALVSVEHFGLRRSEVHVLLGPNGAGKTTLMRALNGLEPAQGELFFEGQPVRSRADRLWLRRRTAAVFQNAYLLSTTVRGNVESGLKLRGVRGAELRRRTDEALVMLGITHLSQRRPSGLSGGEAQRVSIARALAVNPAVVFLDEPMASLDPPTRRTLRTDLEGIFHRLSTAVLWVTHDTEEAHGVADRVTFLDRARVVQEGLVTEVFDRPSSSAVADYLGVDVWLRGSVILGNDEGRFVLPSGAGLRCRAEREGPAVACIHPEDVTLLLEAPTGAPSESTAIEVIVTDVRELARTQLVGLEWQGERLQALLTRASSMALDLHVGMRATAVIAIGAVGVAVESERGH